MALVILFSAEDFEPITVLDVPRWAMDRLRRGGLVTFAIPPRLEMSIPVTCPQDLARTTTCTVWAERFRWKGMERWHLFTRDDAAALALRSNLLPGQRKDFVDAMLRTLGR